MQVNVGASISESKQQQRQAEIKWQQDHWQPKDPYRKIGTNIFYAKSEGWCLIIGTIVQYRSNSIVIEGQYGRPFGQMSPEHDDARIVVNNFPYVIAGKKIELGDGFMALPIGGTIENGLGVMVFDYGERYSFPTNAFVDAMSKKQAEQNKKAFAAVYSLATNGDRVAQYSLGEKYLKGIGCETNVELAVQWFSKAALQGSLEASNRLTQLSVK
ncbi:MAG TPA: hypothetical protein VN625_01600 [Desulfuromonadaceae bacterium]|nr:hypothetical protein [Desulfuromonadaceae bacterium]